ncbi:MAG: 4-hydroxy-tetrahydrodipicolinate reductase [Gammaproteobacteria bacterium]|nr:4-hydroxy-tetrahydrodipicolinate reductase [Gammaproteobacteria bacterium]
MIIDVLVNGANGRMGQATVQALLANPKFRIVGQTGRQDQLAQTIKATKAKVVIDFTAPQSAFDNTLIILNSGAHPVIGTSGMTLEQIGDLQKKAEALKRGGIIAPNFSLGAMLMMKYAKEIARYLPHVEIIEMHHDRKLDSPSGTALRTAEVIAEAHLEAAHQPQQEIVAGSRGANYKGIPIHAIRLPGLLAHQQIIFGETGGTLTLRHDSISRESFMAGVLMASEKVMGMKRLVYGLENILV